MKWIALEDGTALNLSCVKSMVVRQVDDGWMIVANLTEGESCEVARTHLKIDSLNLMAALMDNPGKDVVAKALGRIADVAEVRRQR